MADLMMQLFDLLGVGLTAPQNLSELLPWLVKILLCTGFISFFIGTIRSAVFSVGKGML